jgi:group 4 capsule polysaccharide lipoprotein GfcB/YjbF
MKMLQTPFSNFYPSKVKKALVIGCGLIVLSGCQIQQSAVEKWDALSKVADYMIVNRGAPSVTREQVDAIPFATLGAKLGSTPQAILVLNQVNQNELIWLTNDKKVSITTRHGRIVKTHGLESDLTDTSNPRDVLALPQQKELNGSRSVRVIDLAKDLGYGFSVSCKITVRGSEVITLADNAIRTNVAEEDCEALELNWKFKNTFWLDSKTGYVWRSKQWISPLSKDPLVLEVLRPAAEEKDWQIHTALNARN